MDGECPPSLAVLVFGDVDAVDAFGGVAHPFTHKPVVLPDTHPQVHLILGIGLCRQSETVTTIFCPMAFIIAAIVGTGIGTVTLGFHLTEVACIVSQRVNPDTRRE